MGGGCHAKGAKRARTSSLQGASAPPAGEAENGRQNWRRESILAERCLLGRARGQERVQRCGYAAFCLNSRKGEQQDCRGDKWSISTNLCLGDLHRHRREALRASGPAGGRRRLPPPAFLGVFGDLV